jgi:hypothetical protein
MKINGGLLEFYQYETAKLLSSLLPQGVLPCHLLLLKASFTLYIPGHLCVMGLQSKCLLV